MRDAQASAEPSAPDWFGRAIVGGVAASAVIVSLVIKSAWALALFPLAFGSSLAAVAPRYTFDRVDAARAPLTRFREWGRHIGSRSRIWGVAEFSDYFVRPFTATADRWWRLTDGFRSSPVRTAVRVVGAGYAALAAGVLFAGAVSLLLAVIIGLLLLNLLLSAVTGSGEQGSEERRTPGWFSETECSRCGSKEHSLDRCPHGFLSDSCARCGSVDHATDACPHGFFAQECDRCSSREHSTEDCPHGFLDGQCQNCGSRNHASESCPHGWFENECTHCGSKEHSLENCPH